MLGEIFRGRLCPLTDHMGPRCPGVDSGVVACDCWHDRGHTGAHKCVCGREWPEA